MILDCGRLVLRSSIGALHLGQQVLLLHLVVFCSLSREELLLFPPRTCLHTINSLSFAVEILLSFCLRCLSRAANETLRLSGSYSEPSLLRISAKNHERCWFSSLALYFKTSSLRSLVGHPHLPNIDPSLRSFIVFLLTDFSASCCISFPWSWPPFFLKTKK